MHDYWTMKTKSEQTLAEGSLMPSPYLECRIPLHKLSWLALFHGLHTIGLQCSIGIKNWVWGRPGNEALDFLTKMAFVCSICLTIRFKSCWRCYHITIWMALNRIYYCVMPWWYLDHLSLMPAGSNYVHRLYHYKSLDTNKPVLHNPVTTLYTRHLLLRWQRTV